MYNSSEIARRSLQRAAQIREERIRRKRFAITIGTTTCVFALMLVSVFTVFSPATDNRNAITTFDDPGVPLGNYPKIEVSYCPECSAEITESECKCESVCEDCEHCNEDKEENN